MSLGTKKAYDIRKRHSYVSWEIDCISALPYEYSPDRGHVALALEVSDDSARQVYVGTGPTETLDNLVFFDAEPLQIIASSIIRSREHDGVLVRAPVVFGQEEGEAFPTFGPLVTEETVRVDALWIPTQYAQGVLAFRGMIPYTDVAGNQGAIEASHLTAEFPWIVGR